MSDTVPCKACGRRLLFARTPEGKTIPLDSVAPVYHVTTTDGKLLATRANAYVSHFATCTDPSRFSKAKEKP